ncbi:MAG: hypothetical protein ABIH00_03860 [Armatimonadota bacterium]
MNSVAIIHNPDILNISLNKRLKQVKAKHRKDFIVFIGNNPEQEQVCRKHKVHFLNIDTFARDIDIDEIINTANRLLKIWNAGHSLRYKEVNLSKFFENNVYLTIISTLKSICITHNILNDLKTNFVYLINSPETKHSEYDNLFFYISKVFFDIKNQNKLQVKVNCLKESNISILYNEIKKKYFEIKLFYKKLTNASRCLLKRGARAEVPPEGVRNIAFLMNGSFDENYSHLLDILDKNEKYRMGFLFRDFNYKLSAKFDTKFKKFFPPVVSMTKEYADLAKEIKKLRNEYRHRNLFNYRSCYLWNTILDEVQYLFQHKFYNLLGKVKYFEDVLLKENIKLIIGSEVESDFNKIMFLLARKSGIKTIDLQDDILVDDTFNFAHTYSTKMLVWDRVTAMNLKDYGEKESKIELLGNLKYLHYKERPIPRKKQFCESIGLNPKDKLILIALSQNRGLAGFSDPNINTNLIEWAVNLANNSEGIQIIFRPHPKATDDDVKWLKRVLNGRVSSQAVFVDKSSPLPDLLQNINLFVSGASPVLLDAIYFNKPIIYVNTGAKDLLKRYTEKAVMVEVKNEADFMKNIRLLLSNLKMNKELEVNRQSFIKEYFPPVDTTINEKTVRIVESMLN